MDISLDEIIKSYENNEKLFDYDKVNDIYKNKYEKLSKYYLINPKKLYKLKEGDIIRYSNDVSKISCAGVIVNIIYKKDVINYFILKSLVYKKTWRIYPQSYYIFQYDKNNTKEFYKVIKEYSKNDNINDDKDDDDNKNKKKQEFLSIDELIKQNEKYLDVKTKRKIDKRLKNILDEII